jgi:hypothetical protein
MSTNAISIPEPEERVESKIAETILDFLGIDAGQEVKKQEGQ